MRSAFGVDHGEISKGRIPRIGRPSAAQRRTQGVAGARSGPQKVKDKLNSMGEADISLKGIGSGAGKSVRSVGGFLERRPGLTGTALVGGGSAGAYHLTQKKNKR